MTAPALLTVDRLTKRFGGLRAVSDLDLEVHAGSIHSMIGPNGAGKTTAFNCIAQFIPPTSGEISFDGLRIDGLKPDGVAKAGIARTYQNIRLFKSMSVLDNVLVGRHRHLMTRWWAPIVNLRSFKAQEELARDAAIDLLRYVGLECSPSANAATLSYGDQRRLEIARALATQPRLLMLDEPTAGMNPAEIGDMMVLIRRLRDERSLSILLIEHQVKLVMAISDHVTVLDHGVRIADGPPATVQKNPDVIAAYLGHRRSTRASQSRAAAL